MTAGHTGANSGAQCAETHFDEGAENIWLRNRIAEILTNRYGLVVLVDDDGASLQLLTEELKSPTDPTDNTDIISPFHSDSLSCLRKKRSTDDTDYDFVIDLHFNAHTNPQARGAEAIVSDDATTLELRFASRLAHVTADALGIPLRSIKSESQTPHRRLAMLHLTRQSIILEVYFCTSPEDVVQYRKYREQLAETLAHNIALLLDRKTFFQDRKTR
ncbi:MAG: N-acetylmuramoyl-L-alanine amidase [Paludibacteraceae bacterium]|nr:N-acetylmuramoyl-L-alanine amidase [Paludibacteraceae bacterium]